MQDYKVDAAVGMTRKWDAREAGREVARNTIKNLKNPPNFFIIFSTIHYEKYGGFEEFLKGIWEVLPKGTPLVGGTVVGFINNHGCYTRGASALAVSYPNMDVVLGFGKNTKRSPKKAAAHSIQMIKKDLDKSRFENKFLLNLIAGPCAMKIPGKGYTKVIDSGFISKFIKLAFSFSQYFLQKGFGREDEVFEEIVNKLPDYYMILGTSIDDYKGISHYQFFNEKILTNSVINMGIATDLNLNVGTTHGMKKTDLNFKITKLSKNGHIIHEINNKPAISELSRYLNWPQGFITDKTMVKTILYYPISLRRHGREVPAVMPFILKESIMIPCLIDKGEVSILTVNGKNLVDAMRGNLNFFEEIKPEFGLFTSCATILETLGNNIYIIKGEISHYFNQKPYLMSICVGEGTYSPERNLTYANMSFNTAIFGI